MINLNGRLSIPRVSAIPVLILGAMMVGCTHSIHQVHVSDFQPYAPIERGEVIKGYAEQFVILGFTEDTNYVNDAVRQLSEACPEGAVTGITTQISTSHGFFSWTNKALLQGLCLKRTGEASSRKAAAAGLKRRTQESIGQ